MNTTELIEIARDCKGVVIEQDNVYQADAGEIHFFCADDLQQFVQRIEQPLQARITEIKVKSYNGLNEKNRQIEQLREALQDAQPFVESHCNDESPEGWPAIKALLKIRNALEETK